MNEKHIFSGRFIMRNVDIFYSFRNFWGLPKQFFSYHSVTIAKQNRLCIFGCVLKPKAERVRLKPEKL